MFFSNSKLRKLVLLFGLVFFLQTFFLGSLFAQSVSARSSGAVGIDSLINEGNRDQLLTSLKDKPGPLLLSLGRKARQEGKFSDSILYFKASLRSEYGERRFEEELQATVAEVNKILKIEVRQTLVSYLDAKSKQSIELTLRDSNVDPGAYKKRFELQIRLFFTRALPNELRRGLFESAGRHLNAELKKKFPKNPMKFFGNQGRYYIEGYFNSEYPSILPMAHFELASLYKEYKDFILADFHFKQALDYRAYFEVPETVYSAWYKLAEMSRFSGKANDYEKYLRQIVAADRDYFDSEGRETTTQKVILRSFRMGSQGLDKVVQLYRIKDDFSRDAHRLLGLLYLERNSSEQALPHLLFAVIKPLSRIIDEVKQEVYGFQFRDLSQLFLEISDYPDLLEYVSQAHLYEALYALAVTSYAYERKLLNVSKSILSFLANQPSAGNHSINAREVLKQFR